MKYGRIENEKVVIYGHIKNGKWQGKIEYAEDGTRKTAEQIIANYDLKEILTPQDFTGNCGDYEYTEKDGKIYLVRLKTEIETQRQLTAAKIKISALKQQLKDTDYKVMKCAENQLLGLDMPYDVTDLQRQRQAWREEINVLEAQYGKI